MRGGKTAFALASHSRGKGAEACSLLLIGRRILTSLNVQRNRSGLPTEDGTEAGNKNIQAGSQLSTHSPPKRSPNPRPPLAEPRCVLEKRARAHNDVIKQHLEQTNAPRHQQAKPLLSPSLAFRYVRTDKICFSFRSR